jgi:hypothetical protein
MPPTSVSARQTGAMVSVAFVVPEPRGEKTGMQPVRAELVRVEYPPGNEAPADPSALRRRGKVVAVIDGDPMEQGRREMMIDETIDLAEEPPPWGTTLRYGVRVRDRRGRPSPLVVARDLVPMTPPPPPALLEAIATAEGIRLHWKAPAGEEPARYNLYRREPGGEFPPNPLHPLPLTATEFLDTSVETGNTYVYRVRSAVSDSAPFVESLSPSPVTVLAEDRFAPAAPTGLVVVQEGAGIRLFWDPNREKDLSGYRIYRAKDGGAWHRLEPDPVAQPLFLDAAVEVDDRLAYRITAVDRADPPNESEPSEKVEAVVAADPDREGGR